MKGFLQLCAVVIVIAILVSNKDSINNYLEKQAAESRARQAESQLAPADQDVFPPMPTPPSMVEPGWQPPANDQQDNDQAPVDVPNSQRAPEHNQAPADWVAPEPTDSVPNSQRAPEHNQAP